MNLIKTFLSIGGIVTALMYFHGRAFYTGWLSFWNLEPALFSVPFEQSLLLGYIAYTRMVGRLVGVGVYYLEVHLVTLLIIVGLFPFLIYALYLATKVCTSKFAKVRKIRNVVAETAVLVKAKISMLLIRHPFKILSQIFGGAVLFVFVLTTVINVHIEASYFGYDEGHSQFLGLRESQKLRPTPEVHLSDGETFKGTLITCGSTFCAFYGLSSESEVVVYRKEDIKSSNRPAPRKIRRDSFGPDPRRHFGLIYRLSP